MTVSNDLYMKIQELSAHYNVSLSTVCAYTVEKACNSSPIKDEFFSGLYKDKQLKLDI